MRAFLLFLFFLSGAAALVSGTVWTRKLLFILGYTPIVKTLVLSVIFVNVSLGSMLASRWGRKSEGFLARFAWLQAGIGIAGLAFPLLSSLLKSVYPALALIAEEHIAMAILCWMVLLTPAFLLGATLPVMHTLFIRGSRLLSAQAGVLSAALAFGAAMGTALAGFLLAGRLGLNATCYTAALFHGCIFLAALWLAHRRPELGRVGDEEKSDAERVGGPFRAPPSLTDEARASVVFAAVFCNAFAFMVLQGLWGRTLVFFLGSFVPSHSVMLFTFLATLGLGATVISLLGRSFEFHLASGAVMLVGGGLVACSGLYLLPALHEAMRSICGDPGEFGVWTSLTAGLFGSALVMMPCAFLLSMITPVAVGIQIRERGSSCREAGLIFAAASLGACLGLAAGGWLIIPAFGLKMGIVISGFMAIAAGLLVFLFAKINDRVKTISFLVGIAAIWVFVRILGGDGRLSGDLIFDSHVFKNSNPFPHVVVERNGIQEGNVWTATVVRDVEVRERRLYLDAFHAASNGPSSTYMRMMAHLPVMACSNPERVLVIGYGIGATAGALSLHPEVKRVEIVEASREVMAVAPLFSSVNHLAGIEKSGEGGPAFKTELGRSGRVHLRRSEEPFDLITVGPGMPYHPATIQHHTAEFYALCRERLTPSGILCQSIPIQQLPVRHVKRLLKTFVKGMPGTACFLIEDNLLLLGFQQSGWRLPLDRLEGLFKISEVRGDLEITGFFSPFSLAEIYIADGEALVRSLENEKVLRDDGAYLVCTEDGPNRVKFLNVADNIAFLLAHTESIAPRLDPGAGPEVDEAEFYERLRRDELSARKYVQGREKEARWAAGTAAKQAPGFGSEWEILYEKAFYLNPENRRAARKFSQGLIREALHEIDHDNFTRAHDLTCKAAAIAPELWEVYMAQGYLNLAAGNVTALERIVEILHQVQPYSNLALALRGELFREKGDQEKAANCDSLLLESGGLSAEEKKRLARAKDARKAGVARYAIYTLDVVMELLCMGPEGRVEGGGRAWTLAKAADARLLEEAKKTLLILLEKENPERMAAMKGLGFFQDQDVIERLGALYPTLKGPEREAVLEALARAGDTQVVSQVLKSHREPAPLILKATEIVCDLKITELTVLGALIDLLESEDSTLRLGAFVALVHLTELHYDFDPNGSERERKRAIESWRRWYKIRQNFDGRGK